MQAFVKENIVIKDCTEAMAAFLLEKLTFDNPEYYKRVNSGRWVGDIPKSLSLFQRNGGDVIIPFGMLPILFANSKCFDGGIFHSFPVDAERLEYKSSINLYDYQENAVKAALRARQGIVVAPCGSGKTQIGLEIAARLGKRALWLTHTTDLLNQSMTRAKRYFGLQNSDYGTITAGKVDIGNVITFATVQTMSKLDLAQYRNCFDVVIVDECHHVVGTPTKIMMFYKVISNLRARFKFGLTATPKRGDGLTNCMFAIIGPKICEIERESVKDTTCPVTVKIKKTTYMPDLGRVLASDGTLSYPRFIDDVCGSGERNDLIVNDIVKSNGTCLVLTERIAHIELLKQKLERAGVSVATISGAGTKKAKDERELSILAINNKLVKVLIATYQLAKEGLDIPSLDNLFLATPQKNDVVVTQSAGRVGRKADGKEFGTIYDYEDSFSMLVSWQKKRNRIYNKLGFSVEDSV